MAMHQKIQNILLISLLVLNLLTLWLYVDLHNSVSEEDVAANDREFSAREASSQSTDFQQMNVSENRFQELERSFVVNGQEIFSYPSQWRESVQVLKESHTYGTKHVFYYEEKYPFLEVYVFDEARMIEQFAFPSSVKKKSYGNVTIVLQEQELFTEKLPASLKDASDDIKLS